MILYNPVSSLFFDILLTKLEWQTIKLRFDSTKAAELTGLSK
jgi:hypothetical protein